jgi:hypothetical protein
LPNSAASSAPRLIAIRLINQAVDAELVQSLPKVIVVRYETQTDCKWGYTLTPGRL